MLFNKVIKTYNNQPPPRERSLEEMLAALTKLSPDCDTFKYLQQKVREIYFSGGDPDGEIVVSN